MGEGFNTDEMLDVYLYECEQLLENLSGIVLERKDETSFEEADINEIFRTMHTIKGSSAIMMYDNIAHISHKLEDLFYYLRESKPDNVPHLELVEHVLSVSDFIEGELVKIKNGNEADGSEEALVGELDKFLACIKGEGAEEAEVILQPQEEEPMQFYIAPVETAASHYYKIGIYYREDTLMANIRAYSVTYSLKELALDLFYKPEDIITNEASAEVILKDGFHMYLETSAEKEEILEIVEDGYAEKIDFEEITKQEYDVLCGIAAPEDGNGSMMLTVDDFLENAPKPTSEMMPGDFVVKKEGSKGKKKAKNQAKQSNIISVNVQKMDSLMDLIGELVIAEAVVLQNPDLKVPGLDLTNFQKASAQLAKITTELQEVIMSMRMMPLTNVFQKMKRIVFDVSRKLDKDIDLELIGENTEVDKNIIESISDPLMHLVRNAVDHGIEDDVRARVERGKSAQGKIVLEAKNEGGKVYVTVRDDGKGLSKEKLYQKAKKNGLTGNKEMSEFTDKEI